MQTLLGSGESLNVTKLAELWEKRKTEQEIDGENTEKRAEKERKEREN